MSISRRCHLFEVAFVWELAKETIHLPLGCLQGGDLLALDRAESVEPALVPDHHRALALGEQHAAVHGEQHLVEWLGLGFRV